MELLSCRTRPRHPFHATYSQRKVNTFLLLHACPTFPATSALLANWFQFAEKEWERRGGGAERGDSIAKNTEANKSISYFFSLLSFFHWVTLWQKGRDERAEWRTEGKWLVRARLVPREHIDIWEPVNGDECLKWSVALARSPLGVFNQQPHLQWLRRALGSGAYYNIPPKHNFRLW